jgi:hypothetical protein
VWLIGRKIRLSKRNLLIVGGDTRWLMLCRFCRVCHQFRAKLWLPWRRPAVFGRRIAGFREIETRLIGRRAACVKDPRAPERLCTGWPRSSLSHTDDRGRLPKRQRCRSLRADAMSGWRWMDASDEELCSQSVLGLDPGISRLENLPDGRALLRLQGSTALANQMPKRIVLDIDDAFGRAAASNYACSTPSAAITASSRSPGRLESCSMARGVLSPPCCAGSAAAMIRASCAACWHPRLRPRVRSRPAPGQALLRADSQRLPGGSTGAEKTRRLAAGAGSNAVLRRHVEALENLPNGSPRHRRAARCGTLRNSTMPPAAGAGSSASSAGRGWRQNRYPLYCHQPRGRPLLRIGRLYCARGQAETENHIKAWKNHLPPRDTPVG